MEFTSVKNSEINENLFRLDSEYHVGIQKINLGSLSGSTLSDLCSRVVQGPNPKFVESGIPSLNGKNIYFGTLDVGEPNYISEDEYNELKKFHVKPGDILITLKHATKVGRLWVYRKNSKCLFSRNLGLIRIKGNAKINVETLLLYLWGTTQQQLLNLIATGGTNGQITLSMAELREFPVPEFSEKFQSLLKSKFIESEALNDKSILIFKDADRILLSELGLANWRAQHQLSFVKHYSETKHGGRFDAEYFQPKYDEIVKAIKAYHGGWGTLGNLAKIKDTNFTPIDKQQYKYIELANITGNGEIVDCTNDVGRNLPTRARRKVVSGDIIVSSIEGSLTSIALIDDDYDKALCSTGFHVVHSKQFNPETFLVLLKSIVGQLQLKRGCTGTILTAINKDELELVILPKVTEAKQAEIQQKVIESFSFRKRSRYLLECARRAVEISIEEDEQTAINWLENQTREMHI